MNNNFNNCAFATTKTSCGCSALTEKLCQTTGKCSFFVTAENRDIQIKRAETLFTEHTGREANERMEYVREHAPIV